MADLGFQVVQGLITTKYFLFIRAGEGQLEISINDGDVPNAVQVLGGGKCLVTYTPEEAITHEIEVTFNDEQVSGKFDFPISIERSKVFLIMNVKQYSYLIFSNQVHLFYVVLMMEEVILVGVE